MKFIHISDLHIGKKVYEKSLIDEQAHILNKICDIVSEQQPDAVLIAGDVYDESHAYYEREIYRDVIRDLRKLLFMEVDKERK